MKKYLKLKEGYASLLLLSLAYGAQAQFSSGSSFYVEQGTPLFIDSLTLEPVVSSLTMVNTNITVSHTPIPPSTTGSGSIERVYDINPPVSFRGTTGVYYLDSELNGNTPALLSYVYDDGSATFSSNNLVTVDNSNNYVTATTGVNTITLKRVTTVDAGVVLPVDLLSFSAKAEGKRTLINWITANEFNCDHFDVERSADGVRFNFLVSELSKGHTTGEHKYGTYDNTPLAGWNYYRLKQVDMDGRFTYSKVEPVFFGDISGTEVLVYPNPAVSILNVVIRTESDNDEELLLLDATGRVIAQQNIRLSAGINTYTMNLDHMAGGAYLLKVGSLYKIKVVKQ